MSKGGRAMLLNRRRDMQLSVVVYSYSTVTVYAMIGAKRLQGIRVASHRNLSALGDRTFVVPSQMTQPPHKLEKGETIVASPRESRSSTYSKLMSYNAWYGLSDTENRRLCSVLAASKPAGVVGVRLCFIATERLLYLIEKRRAYGTSYLIP